MQIVIVYVQDYNAIYFDNNLRYKFIRFLVDFNKIRSFKIIIIKFIIRFLEKTNLILNKHISHNIIDYCTHNSYNMYVL